jgi:hypothetical protein
MMSGGMSMCCLIASIRRMSDSVSSSTSRLADSTEYAFPIDLSSRRKPQDQLNNLSKDMDLAAARYAIGIQQNPWIA